MHMYINISNIVYRICICNCDLLPLSISIWGTQYTNVSPTNNKHSQCHWEWQRWVSWIIGACDLLRWSEREYRTTVWDNLHHTDNSEGPLDEEWWIDNTPQFATRTRWSFVYAIGDSLWGWVWCVKQGHGCENLPHSTPIHHTFDSRRREAQNWGASECAACVEGARWTLSVYEERSQRSFPRVARAWRQWQGAGKLNGERHLSDNWWDDAQFGKWDIYKDVEGATTPTTIAAAQAAQAT